MSNNEVHLNVLSDAPQKPISNTFRYGLLVIGSLMCISSSVSFAFNLIAEPMRERYHFTQRDISSINMIGLVFQYFCLPYAYIFEFFGPKPVLVLALVMSTTGTVCFAMCFEGKIQGTMARLSVFNAFMGIGCSTFDLVACVTVVGYFPTRRGIVIALLKVFVGLGSALLGSINQGLLNNNRTHYFFFLMAIGIVSAVLGLIFMAMPDYQLTWFERRRMTPEKIKEREGRIAQYLRQPAPWWRFFWGFGCLAFLIIWLPLTTALTNYLKLPHKYSLGFACVVVIVSVAFALMCVPEALFHYILLPFPCHDRWMRAIAGSEEGEVRALGRASGAQDELEPELVDEVQGESVKGAGMGVAEGDEPIDDELLGQEPTDSNGVMEKLSHASTLHAAKRETDVDYIAPQYQGTFLQNLLKPDLWCMLWYLTCLAGAELVVIMNAAAIMGALGGAPISSTMTTLLTVLNGVGSALSRIAMSLIEHFTQNVPPEKRIPLTWVPMVPFVMLIISFVFFLTLPAAALPLPYVIVAIANGFQAASTVLIARTVFAKSPALHYNFCFLSAVIASIACVRFLYGEYVAVRTEKLYNDATQRCLQKSCVMVPMIVLLVLCITGCATCLYTHFRYVFYCRRVLRARALALQEDQNQDDFVEEAQQSNSGEIQDEDENAREGREERSSK